MLIDHAPYSALIFIARVELNQEVAGLSERFMREVIVLALTAIYVAPTFYASYTRGLPLAEFF